MTILLTFCALLFPSLAAPAGPCAEVVVSQMYACADGHAYTNDSQGWHDIGPLHREQILVPALLER